MKEREDVKTDEGEESRKRVKTKRRRIKKGIEEEKVFVIHKLYVYNKVEKKKQTNKERKREEIV